MMLKKRTKEAAICVWPFSLRAAQSVSFLTIYSYAEFCGSRTLSAAHLKVNLNVSLAF